MLSSGRSPTESGRVCTSAFPSSSYPHRADGGEAAALPSRRPALRPAWDRRSPFLRPLPVYRWTSSPHTASLFFPSSLPPRLLGLLKPWGSPGVRPCPGLSFIFVSAARERTTGRSALPRGAAGCASGGRASVMPPACAPPPPPPRLGLWSLCCCSSPWRTWAPGHGGRERSGTATPHR